MPQATGVKKKWDAIAPTKGLKNRLREFLEQRTELRWLKDGPAFLHPLQSLLAPKQPATTELSLAPSTSKPWSRSSPPAISWRKSSIRVCMVLLRTVQCFDVFARKTACLWIAHQPTPKTWGRKLTVGGLAQPTNAPPAKPNTKTGGQAPKSPYVLLQ